MAGAEALDGDSPMPSRAAPSAALAVCILILCGICAAVAAAEESGAPMPIGPQSQTGAGPYASPPPGTYAPPPGYYGQPPAAGAYGTPPPTQYAGPPPAPLPPAGR